MSQYDFYPKPLSSEKFKEYFNRYKMHNDKEAEELLILHNMRLVARIASKFQKTYQDIDELISVGGIGLWKAIQTFKIDKGFKFSNYAGRCIENEILMVLRRKKDNDNETSFEETIGEDNDSLRLENAIKDPNGNIEEILEKKDEEKLAREIVVSLSEKDTFIVSLLYGFFGNAVHTQAEVAAALGISRSYVSRLNTAILEKLKTELANPRTKRKGKKPVSLFKLLKGYTKEEIFKVIDTLNEEELILLDMRYGRSLTYPRTSPYWSKFASHKFYAKLLPKMKKKLELNRAFMSTIKVSRGGGTLSPEERYNREKFNEIHECLLRLDYESAHLALNEYLRDNNLIRFEPFIISLIILSIKEGDTLFTRPMLNLYLLSKNSFLNIDRYKEYFYEALKVDLVEARLYLDIILNLNKEQDMSENTTAIEKAYNMYLERVKK